MCRSPLRWRRSTMSSMSGWKPCKRQMIMIPSPLTGQAADWIEVLAVFAVKVAGADVDAADVATMDADRIARLKAVFWDMTTITHRVEIIHHPGSGDDDGWTERNLYITITAKTAEEMKTEYHFNRNQIAALDELLEQRDLLRELIEDVYSVSGDTAALLRNLPEDLSPEREAVVRTACSLVGKVNYFWGGKSPCHRLGRPLGRAAAGHGGGQLHHRDLPPLRAGLQWFCGLGVLQSVWRQLCHRPRRRSHHAAQLLHRYFVGGRTAR